MDEGGIDLRLKAIEGRFMQTLPDRIREIRNASGAGNWENVDEFAHKIKGTGACLGLDEISKIGKEIQILAKAKETLGLDRKLVELNNLFEMWKRELA